MQVITNTTAEGSREQRVISNLFGEDSIKRVTANETPVLVLPAIVTSPPWSKKQQGTSSHQARERWNESRTTLGVFETFSPTFANVRTTYRDKHALAPLDVDIDAFEESLCVEDDEDDDETAALLTTTTDNVFFLGDDEVGEITLSDFNAGVDDDETNHGMLKSISKTITPTNNNNDNPSPTGLFEERQDATMEWTLQQQVRRLTLLGGSNTTPKTPSKATWFTRNYPGHNNNTRRFFASPDSAPRRFMNSPMSPILHQEDSRNEEEEDGMLDLPQFIPRIKSPIAQDYAIKNLDASANETNTRRPPVEEEDEYQVQSSLPTPSSTWYNEFFGKKQQPSALDTFGNNFFRKPPKTLQDIFSDDELLCWAGFRDHGNGLAEC